MKGLLALAVAGAALALPGAAVAQAPAAPDCPPGTEPAWTVTWPAREVPMGQEVYPFVQWNAAGPWSLKIHGVMRGDTHSGRVLRG